MPEAKIDRHAVDAFIQLEAHLLDTRQWDAWLALYAPDAEYVVPMWDDDGQLTSDPKTELSLIYYATRQGLEDRVFRLATNKSAASTPLFRTCHIRSRAVAEHDGDLIRASFSWVTHCYRLKQASTYFGLKDLWLSTSGDGAFAVARSRTIVHNDLIDQVLDFYHL